MVYVLLGFSVAINVVLLALLPLYLKVCKKNVLEAKKEMEEKYHVTKGRV